jgi:phosphatidylglycerol lysyltransferase
MLEGRLMPDHLYRRRLFVAQHEGSSGIEAFLVCNPYCNGREWGFEIYRRRRNATRGVMPYLMRSVIDQLQSEGDRRVSLCVVPGKGARQTRTGSDHWLIRQLLGLWYERLNFLFNVKGQEHYKSRFRPTMRDRYICVSRRSSAWSISSFLWTVGAGNNSPTNVLRAARRGLAGCCMHSH